MDMDDRGREWLRTTLYSIGDAVITTGTDGRVREMNPVAEALTGWREHEARGRLFSEVFVALNEDTRARVSDPVTAILRDGLVIGLANHTLLVARDGVERPIADSGAPIRDAAGALVGTVIVFRDQSEERQRIRALENSEARHRELYVANPHAMWFFDHETLAFLDVNDAAIARYGYSREQFLTMTLADIRPPEDVAAMKADAAAAPPGFEGGRRWRHRRRDGTPLTVEISSSPVPWPGRDARVVLVHDVSAQEALEARLRWQAQLLTRLASREPLQGLLDELVTFICTLCPGVSSTVMLLDAKTAQLRPAAAHGVPAEVQQAADPTPVAELHGVCGTAASRRQPFVVSDVASDPAFALFRDVTARFGLKAAWSYPFSDSRGTLLGTVAMYASDLGPPTAAEVEVTTFAATLAGVVVERARDLEALREREAQLLQAQKLESVGRLAGGVAHDFNNMLSVIMGQTELALQDLPPGSSAAEGLTQVLNAAQRSARLTRQLLAFARQEPSKPRTIDLNARIADLVGMLERLIGAGVAVAWRPGPGLWPVRVDPGQFDQVLTNLAVNARDAMSGAGTLSVTTANVVRAEADGLPAGDYVCLTVSDTGTGMVAGTLGRIFEPFFTTKPLGEGTGLGLATVYGIVRQHGGAIEVDSAPGRGATFRLLLPRSPDRLPAKEARTTSRPTGGHETILVVEDEPALLALIAQVLRREGYEVLSAHSPREAEAIVSRHAAPLHLVITDMVMPGMNGRELWGRLSALRPALRCLVMSGYTNDAAEARPPADVPHLQKPFPMRTLIETVRSILDGAAPVP